MVKYKKTMSVAGIHMTVESETPFHFSERSLGFEVENDCSDAVFHLKLNMPVPERGEILARNDRDYVMRSGEKICKVRYLDGCVDKVAWYLYQVCSDPIEYDICVCGTESEKEYSMNPLFYVDLANFLSQFDAAVLHSSFIRYKGMGIVFSAPSQTGKSTQAELWNRWYGAEILNGDRTILRKTEQGYSGWGSPYAGSSEIYKNESAPMRAVVVLRQAKENRIRRMNRKEAFLCLISQLSVSSISKETVQSQSEWLLDLMDHVPVYLLECLPNREATDLLHSTLKDDQYAR